ACCCTRGAWRSPTCTRACRSRPSHRRTRSSPGRLHCSATAYNPPMRIGHLNIDDDELVERFVRSAGPGGQNVNKVATAVELRFDVANSPSLTEPVRERLLARRDRRM